MKLNTSKKQVMDDKKGIKVISMYRSGHVGIHDIILIRHICKRKGPTFRTFMTLFKCLSYKSVGPTTWVLGIHDSILICLIKL